MTSGRRGNGLAFVFSLVFHGLLLGVIAVMQVRQVERGEETLFYAVVSLPPSESPRVRTRPVARQEGLAPVAPSTWSQVESPKQRFEPMIPSLPLLSPPDVNVDLQLTVPQLEQRVPSGLEDVETDGTSRPWSPQREWTSPTPLAGAQERPGLQMSVALASETPNLPKDSASFLHKNPLEILAENIALRPRGVETDRVDLVFLLDVSQSMQDNIYAVARYIERMAERLLQGDLDYQIGVVTFRHTTLTSALGNDLSVTPLTKDLVRIRRTLERVKCKGGERALNALVDAIPRVAFRPDASRHFVLVTDEYVTGSYSTQEVLGALYRARIQVDVIGMDEPFQRALAARTGGMWMPITNLSN